MNKWFWLILYSPSILLAQLQPVVVDQGKKHLPLFIDFLALPCDAAIPADMEPNIRWVETQFTAHGFESLRLITPTQPVLLLEKKCKNPQAPTVMMYFHADGQSVRPAEWQQESPYLATLKSPLPGGGWDVLPLEKLQGDIDPDWRLFARAVSDDKGPGVMLLAALASLKAQGNELSYHLKVLVDFEEEQGSTSLPGIISQHKADLQSDILLILDGPAHPSQAPTLTYGARGITTLTLTVWGPATPLHSGHFGNYAPNPVFTAARLIQSIKDEEGRVLVKGYYEGIAPSQAVLARLRQVPDDIPALNKRLGVQTPERVGATYQESLLYPSLNIRGIQAAQIGSAAGTVIPDKVVIEIDIRTVMASKPEALVQKVRRHIETQGFHIVPDQSPSVDVRMKHSKLASLTVQRGYEAFGTAMDGPVSAWIRTAVQSVHATPIVEIPTMGGSVPIAPFVAQLQVPAIIVPTVNADNNQHAANENLRLGHYFQGIQTLLGILSTPFPNEARKEK